MNGFKVKLKNLNEIAESFSLQVGTLNKCHQGIVGAHKSLEFYSSFTQNINGSIVKIEESVLEIAASMMSISEALEAIVATYQGTESTITGNSLFRNTIQESSSHEELDFWGALRNSFVQMGIIPAEKQNRYEGKSVEEYQEKEMNLYMQNQLKVLKEKKRYSKENWTSATIEERKSILNDYLQEIASVMGFTIEPIHYIYEEANEGGTYTKGGYYNKFDYIKINEWVLKNKANSYELMLTLEHEMRHKYQYEVCNNPEKYVVTNKTINEWQESYNNYRNQSGFMEEGMSEDDAYQAYRNQAIEIDAREFSKQK